MWGDNSPLFIKRRSGTLLEQPLINYISSFDANKDYVLEFTYLGAERVTTNEIQIRVDKLNSLPIYTRQSTKFDKNHTIPGRVLTNGVTYRAKIRVQSQNGEWSVWSPEETFTCLTTPKIVFQNLQEDKFVYNNDILFQAYFQQEQGDRVETYQFSLLDSNGVALQRYPVRRPESRLPNVMQERISNLDKGRLYYVKIDVMTESGLEYADRHEFVAHYVAPSTSGIIEVKPDQKNGTVLMQAYLTQSLGIQVTPKIENGNDEGEAVMPVDYAYIDGDKVIIPPHRPLRYDRLGMAQASDFVLKLWCEKIPNGMFLEFISEHRSGVGIQFEKRDNRVLMHKQYLNEDDNGIKSVHASNVIEGLGKQAFYLYVKLIEFRPEIYIELES